MNDYFSMNETIKEYKFIIAIPSYKRADTLVKKTLPFIISQTIHPSEVNIFVANEEEKENYIQSIQSSFDSEISEQWINRIIIGQKGMKEIRNFIMDYYPPYKPIVQIDDDIEDLLILKDPRTETDILSGQLLENCVYFESMKESKSLRAIIRHGFSQLEKVGTNLFSISAVANKRFMLNKQKGLFVMKPEISIGKYYCMGGFWGWFNPDDYYFKATLDDKEDFERSLKVIKRYSKVIRFNHIAAKTIGYQGKGGMNTEERTIERIKNSCNSLVKEFSELCEHNTHKKSKYPEIRIKKNYT